MVNIAPLPNAVPEIPDAPSGPPIGAGSAPLASATQFANILQGAQTRQSAPIGDATNLVQNQKGHGVIRNQKAPATTGPLSADQASSDDKSTLSPLIGLALATHVTVTAANDIQSSSAGSVDGTTQVLATTLLKSLAGLNTEENSSPAPTQSATALNANVNGQSQGTTSTQGADSANSANTSIPVGQAAAASENASAPLDPGASFGDVAAQCLDVPAEPTRSSDAQIGPSVTSIPDSQTIESAPAELVVPTTPQSSSIAPVKQDSVAESPPDSFILAPLIAGVEQVDAQQSAPYDSNDVPPMASGNPKKAEANNREQIAAEITSGLQTSLINLPTKVIPATEATGASADKQSQQASVRAPSPVDAQDSSKQGEKSAASSNSGYSDNANGNEQKNSALDSATAVKAAGQTVVSVDQPLHVPADAPAQSAGASAGSTAHQQASADVSSALKAAPAMTTLPASLSDVVKASELYQRVGGAEMRIEMTTDILGSIELRTVVHQSTVTATIGVERADVQNLLVNELPALQHALSEQNLHVEHISVLDNTIGARTDLGGQSQQQNGPAPHTPAAGVPLDADAGWMEESQFFVNEVPHYGAGAGRLSIHV